MAGEPEGNCPGFKSRVTRHCGSDTNVNRAVNTGKPLCKVTQQSTERERVKCFKQARPSLCGSEWKHNIRGHRLRNLQAEKKHAREITLNCTEQWRESALEATRSLGKHCVKDTLETYLHECSAQSLRKAACTGIPPLHVLKCFHYEPGCDTWFFRIISSVRTQEWSTMST